MSNCLVTITSFNKSNKMSKRTIEVETKTEAARLMLTFQPPRGYEVFSFFIHKDEKLL